MRIIEDEGVFIDLINIRWAGASLIKSR